MRTFYIATLGCKVNHYETEQLAALLRRRGLVQVHQPQAADLRLVNTCSVTIQAASKSRQTTRQLSRIPLPQPTDPPTCPAKEQLRPSTSRRVIVTGCWATSDPAEAANLPGVSAVLGHHDNLAEKLDHLLTLWQSEDQTPTASTPNTNPTNRQPPESLRNDGSMIKAGTLAARPHIYSKPHPPQPVKENPAGKQRVTIPLHPASPPSDFPFRRSPKGLLPTPLGPMTLPQLDARQTGHQRAFLKIQDGCDAHCTYCIIPKLRPTLWSKPIDDTLAEARRLVQAGHIELVLTGIFLGAYSQPTALRRRQPTPPASPLARLIDVLCTGVPGLCRLRLSSLEPGDLSDDLLSALRSHPQVVPHFHLPLQSGSDSILRRMNRQYTRDDFLAMIDRLRAAFDRPALTTDIIVGFPGETDDRFNETLDVVDRAAFIHIHAFPFSPRPGTAAARWTDDFVHGPVVNHRSNTLRRHAQDHGLAFRRQFLNETVEIMVERPNAQDLADPELVGLQHGRCERYFPVFFDHPDSLTGHCVKVRIDRVTPARTFGTLLPSASGNGQLTTGNWQL